MCTGLRTKEGLEILLMEGRTLIPSEVLDLILEDGSSASPVEAGIEGFLFNGYCRTDSIAGHWKNRIQAQFRLNVAQFRQEYEKGHIWCDPPPGKRIVALLVSNRDLDGVELRIVTTEAEGPISAYCDRMPLFA